MEATKQGAETFIVATMPDDALAGFCSFKDDEVKGLYVAPDWARRGVGSALLRALFPLAAALDKHVMVGGIDAANEGSLRLHERLGFERVAHFREVGRKFDRWLDLVFVQRFIDAPGAPRPH